MEYVVLKRWYCVEFTMEILDANLLVLERTHISWNSSFIEMFEFTSNSSFFCLSSLGLSLIASLSSHWAWVWSSLKSAKTNRVLSNSSKHYYILNTGCCKIAHAIIIYDVDYNISLHWILLFFCLVLAPCLNLSCGNCVDSVDCPQMPKCTSAALHG